MRSTVVVDAGPLVALVDPEDPAHDWAKVIFTQLPGRFLTFEAAVSEAMHILDNQAGAWETLGEIVARLFVVPLTGEDMTGIFREGRKWAPRMDFADACAVHLVRAHSRAFALTTDFRDFAAYRVPFASPEGQFFG